MPLDNSIPFVRSPNVSSRDGFVITGTVIHYTAGGVASGSISWLCNETANASAHFVIARDGTITQLVEILKKAWHAGTSEWIYNGEETSNVSRYTIGIELANHGLLIEDGGRLYYELGRTHKQYKGPEPVRATLFYDSGPSVAGFWEPYPDAQLDSLQELLRKIAAAGYPAAATNLVGHEEVGMPLGRKMDPGAAFPWERFYRTGPRRTRSSLHPS